MQNTSQLLMIRPARFGFNVQTSVNNSFQQDTGHVHAKALQEFDAFVTVLRKNKLNVTVIEDTPEPFTPDSIFPNNWISFHDNGRIFLYPMFAPNRRKERKEHVLKAIGEKFIVNEIADLSKYENDGLFLEGTGSMVLDRNERIAYACLSPRTDRVVLDEFCRLSGYSAITFTATDRAAAPIYHTNVMMCIADRYSVVCLESISVDKERNTLINSFQRSNKELIDISPEQLEKFAGNMLQVMNTDGEQLLALSSQAYRSLNAEQLKTLQAYNRIIHSPLDTIEAAGGGSARCMMAEVFLDKK